MNVGDFRGHVFLPPYIRVPVSWLPGHGTAMGVPIAATPPTGTVAVVAHTAAADHLLPLALGQS